MLPHPDRSNELAACQTWTDRIDWSKFKVYPGFGVQPKGHLALQDHGDEVCHRNLKVRDLSKPMPGEKELLREFVERVQTQCVGQQVLKGVTPGQQIVKIIHDELVDLLGSENAALNLKSNPAGVLMVGLRYLYERYKRSDLYGSETCPVDDPTPAHPQSPHQPDRGDHRAARRAGPAQGP